MHGLDSEVHKNTEHIQIAETHIDTNTRRIKMLAYKQMEIETKLKQNNLIFRGICDVRDENVYEFIDDIMRDKLQIDSGVVYIEQAHRLGSYAKAATYARQNNDVPRRPILVKFRHQEDAERVLSRASNLRFTKFSIDRDYPSEIVAARRRIWSDFKQLRNDNPRSKVVLKYPARIEVDGHTVCDQFPDWHELNKERVSCDYTHAIKRPATLQQSDTGACAHPQDRTIQHKRRKTARVNANRSVNVYDADTESESDLQRQSQRNVNKQSTNDLPPKAPPVPRISQITQTVVIPSGSDDNGQSQSQSLINPSTNTAHNSSSLHGSDIQGVNQNTNIVTREDNMSLCSDTSSETTQTANHSAGNPPSDSGERTGVLDPTQSQHETGSRQNH